MLAESVVSKNQESLKEKLKILKKFSICLILKELDQFAQNVISHTLSRTQSISGLIRALGPVSDALPNDSGFV